MIEKFTDIRVAEEIMGWTLYNHRGYYRASTQEDYDTAYDTDDWGWNGRGDDKSAYDWSPTEDASQALLVLEKITEQGNDIHIELLSNGAIRFVIGWMDENSWSRNICAAGISFADTACLIALKRMGHND